MTDDIERVPYEQLGGKAKMLTDFALGYAERKRLEARLEQGVTFVDYKFIRKHECLIMDKELTLESLQLNEGDILKTKLSDTGQIYFRIQSKESANVV